MTESAPAPVAPVPAAKVAKKPVAKKAPAAKKTNAIAKKAAAPIGIQIEEVLSTVLKSRTGASSKKIIAALADKGLNGSVKINPEESARRKKAAKAKVTK